MPTCKYIPCTETNLSDNGFCESHRELATTAEEPSSEPSAQQGCNGGTTQGKIDWPPNNHKQYVNLQPDDSHPEYGSELKVKVFPAADGDNVGKKLILEVTFAETNSDRNDNPKPSFEGDMEISKGIPKIKNSKEIKQGEDHVVFTDSNFLFQNKNKYSSCKSQ